MGQRYARLRACALRIAAVSLLTDTFGYRRALNRPRCLAHALPDAHP